MRLKDYDYEYLAASDWQRTFLTDRSWINYTLLCLSLQHHGQPDSSHIFLCQETKAIVLPEVPNSYRVSDFPPESLFNCISTQAEKQKEAEACVDIFSPLEPVLRDVSADLRRSRTN